MQLRQFYLQSLGHASYLVGSEETGEALLLDPRRDVDDYFAATREHDLRIAYVIDTHGHNDYLTGISEVTARTRLEVLASAAGDYGYEHRPVRDGEMIEMGEVGIEVMHTPGHTPEHVSLLLYDRTMGDTPAVLLSGGALLVGDLARPDLLGGEREAREAAQVFCRTIQEKILPLPDHIEVFPTHVAGSLCGGSIGSRLSTTVGYERRTNAILAEVSSKDEFVTECIRIDNLPAVPPYWRRMRAQNMAGPARLGVLAEPPALSVDDIERETRSGAIILDTRPPEAFGAAHVPGSLNVGFGTAFPTWAGTVLPEGAKVILVCDRAADVWGATWELLRIGYDTPVGWLAGGIHAWRTSGKALGRIEQTDVHALRERMDREDVAVLDVRQPAEWVAGRIRGATHITGAELPERIGDVPDSDRPLAVVCGSGFRSGVAASLLARAGREHVVNVLGGMGAWTAAGYPTER